MPKTIQGGCDTTETAGRRDTVAAEQQLADAGESVLRTESDRSTAQLTAIIDSMPAAIVMVDDQGRIELVNALAGPLFGYTAAELLGELVDILVPYRFRTGPSGLRTLLTKNPNLRPMAAGPDLFGLRKDGTEFPIEIGVNSVKTAEGSFVLSAIVDISERERKAAELQHANEALERSNIELQRFAYVASHDLQTPMRSVASFVELLRTHYGEGLDERANDWMRRTHESIRHLQTLIRDLLEYSKIDTQARPFERVSMREVVDHALLLLDASVRESHAEVTCHDLPAVMGDRSQLVQLMLNLIVNAIKYRGKESPRIDISAQRKGDEWLFAVSDNGIGMVPKHHERIFEIFQRLHDQKEYPGTGIGLAVCRRVVHWHGGKIWVESTLGRGSVFYFTIAEGAVGSP